MTLPALGIDLGLSGARAAVIDRQGRLIGRGRVAAKSLCRQAGRAELAPESCLEDALAAARLALAEAGCAAVAGIGIGALGPCPILIDGQNRALAPAPLFSLDRRAEGHRQALAEASGLGAERLGPDHAMAKLLWWREHRPALIERAAMVVDLTGYLVAALTGRAVMDPITAADYRLPAIASPVPLPEPMAGDAIAGALLPEMAARLGLAPGAPVAVGTYDSFVDVAGSGTLASGEACIIVGTTMILGSILDRPIDVPGLRASPHLGAGWFVGGWTSSAGSLLDWARATLGEGEDEAIEQLAPGAGGLLALPYFAGERAPVWDPFARGAILGLTLESTRAEIGRAVIDAVALSARDLAERLGGLAIRRWRLGGGGARRASLARALADALGTPLEVLAHLGEALAPALLAFRAIGHRLDPPIERVVKPQPSRQRRYDELYPIYRGLYPVLAEPLHALGKLSGSGDAS